MLGDKNFTKLQDYIGATTNNLLNEWGCDVEQYKIYFTELWVQEFSRKGGGQVLNSYIRIIICLVLFFKMFRKNILSCIPRS